MVVKTIIKYASRSRIRSLAIMAIFVLSSTVKGIGQTKQDSAQKKQFPIIYFDKSKLNAYQQQVVIQAVTKIQASNKMLRSVPVNENDNLYKIIKRYYDYVDDASHHVTQELIDQLKQINNLKSNVIRAGDKLKVPRIPVKTAARKTDSLVQYFDIYNHFEQLYSANILAIRKHDEQGPGESFNQAALFAYQLSPKDVNKFINLISDTLYQKLAKKKAVRVVDTLPLMVEVKYLENDPISNTNSYTIQSTASDERAKAMLATIRPENFGNFYVLDDFGGDCPHGKKVSDVIQVILKRFGISPQLTHITEVSDDYFANKKGNNIMIENLYKERPDDEMYAPLINVDKTSSIAYLNEYANSGKEFDHCKDCVPVVFISALFKKYYYEFPDVISTSIYVPTPDPIMPIMVDTNTYLVTAGLNDPGTIEAVISKKQTPGKLPTTVEPIATYAKEYDQMGAIIVGARMNNNTSGGFISKSGKLVTTLGQGTNWGDGSNCIQRTESGTSFATPEVATKLYLAKAYWRSLQLSFNATEARRRLLLATNMEAGFIGKFASGGTVNLEKLLQTGDGYLETIEGQIVPIYFNKNSDDIVSYDKISQSYFKRKPSADARDSYLTGLGICENGAYAFSDTGEKWFPITLRQLSINFHFADGKPGRIESLDDFKQKYKQIVVLR